jgi:hypothetical protein
MDYKLLEKFNVNFDVDNIISVIESSESFKFYSPQNDGKGLFYYAAPEPLVNELKTLLPEGLRSGAEISLCKILKGAIPHRDHDCASKINFYLKAGSAKTIFFEDPDTEGHSYHNNHQHNIYDIKEHRLRKSSQFVAKDGETYLLDTSRIHTVLMPENEIRIIVSISFSKPFDEVLGKLTVA